MTLIEHDARDIEVYVPDVDAVPVGRFHNHERPAVSGFRFAVFSFGAINKPQVVQGGSDARIVRPELRRLPAAPSQKLVRPLDSPSRPAARSASIMKLFQAHSFGRHLARGLGGKWRSRDAA